MSQSSSTQVFATLEQEAYHAYREWHVYLILRQRQLQQALTLTQPKKENATNEN